MVEFWESTPKYGLLGLRTLSTQAKFGSGKYQHLTNLPNLLYLLINQPFLPKKNLPVLIKVQKVKSSNPLTYLKVIPVPDIVHY